MHAILIDRNHRPAEPQPGQRKAKTPAQRPSGFTLVELMIVVAVIGLLAAIAIPSFIHARESSWRAICVANLKAMESAKNQAALELKWGTDVGPTTMGNPLYKDTVSQYLREGVRPVCPSGVDCYYNAIGEKATCTSSLPGHEI